jgi:hypothetical protein
MPFSRSRRKSRGVRALTAFVLGLPMLSGCYEYVPMSGSTPKVGEVVTLQISDSGRVGLSDRFGSGLAAIEGRIQSTQPDLYVIDVFKVSQLNGESALWSGESVRLQRAYVAAAMGREFSRTRTALMAIGAAAIAGTLLASTHLIGNYNGPTDEPTPPKPASVRIPIRLTF